MKSCLIIEDVPDLAYWIRSMVEQVWPGLQVVSLSSLKAFEQYWDTGRSCDLALIDLGLPDGSGHQIIPVIKSQSPDVICVVQTIFDDDENLFRALQIGADGYLLKSLPQHEFIQALKNIEHGYPPVSPAIAMKMIHFFRTNSGQVEKLTARQSDVLGLIGAGMSTKQTADKLGISYNTCCDHLKEVYRRLHISSRAEAALVAARLGLVQDKVSRGHTAKPDKESMM